MRVVVALALVGCGRVDFAARDAGTGAGDAGSDASASGACNPMSMVFDTFDGPTFDDELWGGSYDNVGTSYAQTGGAVVLTPATNIAPAYAGVRTFRYYDLRGQRIAFELPQLASGGATTGVQAEYGPNQYVAVAHQNGTVLAAVNDSGNYVAIDTKAYSASSDRFFGLSERDGTVQFETSADGITYAPFAQTSPPFEVSLVRPVAYVGSETLIASPGEAHVDSAGTSGGARGASCAIGTFTDTFGGTALDHKWSTSADSCCAVTVNGTAAMQTDGTVGEVVIRGAPGLDLRGGEIRVELVVPPTKPDVYGVLEVLLGFSDYIELEASATQTITRIVTDGVGVSNVQARNLTERFLRLDEAGGTVHFSVSADGTTWRQLDSVVPTFALDRVVAVLRLDTAIATTADAVGFDNLNVP